MSLPWQFVIYACNALLLLLSLTDKFFKDHIDLEGRNSKTKEGKTEKKRQDEKKRKDSRTKLI